MQVIPSLTSNTIRIPAARRARQLAAVHDEIIQAVARVVATGVTTPGREVAAFEREFADWVGVRHAIGVSGGGEALTLALLAVGVRAGDDVVSIPTVDMGAMAPLMRTGARVRWADVDPSTHLLDPASLPDSLGGDQRAVVATHMYGVPCDVSALAEATTAATVVVEDASVGPGATLRGKRVGSLGLLGCFSLSSTKPLGALGRAGVVTTDDETLAEGVRELANYGLGRRERAAIDAGVPGARFRYRRQGFNAALDEVQAAALRVLLPFMDERVEKRRRWAARYRRALSSLPPHQVTLPTTPAGADPAPRVFVVRVVDRDRVVTALHAAGIGCSVQYVPPLHRQAVFSGLADRDGPFPGADQVADELLCLPVHPELSAAEVDEVAEAVAVATASDTGGIDS